MTEPIDRRWRRLPPVHSPLDPRDVVAAALAARADTEEALRTVRARSRKRYDARRVVLTGSGTAGLTLALRVAIRRGGTDRVALPAYSCFDVATAAAGAGVDAVPYDLDPPTLSPDVDSVERALERGARTVVVAHLYGYPADVPAVRRRAEAHGALVIDDAAQAAGGRLEGRPLGAHASLGVLSFGRGKGTSAGGGGAVFARTQETAAALAEETGSLDSRRRPAGSRELAVALAQWAMGRPALYRVPASLAFLGLGETRYRPPRPPRPMSAFSARLLHRTLARREGGERETRRRNARRLRSRIDDAPGLVTVEPLAAAEPGHLRLPVLLEGGAGGAERPELGVMPGYPTLLAHIPAFRPHVATPAAGTPGAARLRDTLVTAPTHSWLTPADIDGIARSLIRAARSRTPG